MTLHAVVGDGVDVADQSLRHEQPVLVRQRQAESGERAEPLDAYVGPPAEAPMATSC